MLVVELKFNKFHSIGAAFPRETRLIVRKATLDAYAESQTTVPVRRDQRRIRGGFLKNSGQVSFTHDYGEIKYTAHYAGYVHEGTFRMAARPFLRNAVHHVYPQMIAAFSSLERRLS